MFIRNWCKALRSDRYTQGMKMLYNAEDETFCPLGVACDMVNPRFKNRKPEMLDCSNFVVPMGDDVSSLVERYPLFESYVAFLNDVVGASFSQIADQIESLARDEHSNYDFYVAFDGPIMVHHMAEKVLV